MSVSKKHLAALRERIIKAFANVPYPKESLAPHECDECREIREIFAGQKWNAVPSGILADYHDALPLFSPEAFHYFLPAYLIHSVDNFGENYDTTCQFTIYALTPNSKNIKTGLGHWRERFAHFSAEQMDCIYEFLDLVRIDENFENFVREVSAGRQNLKEFVDPNLEKIKL